MDSLWILENFLQKEDSLIYKCLLFIKKNNTKQNNKTKNKPNNNRKLPLTTNKPNIKI